MSSAKYWVSPGEYIGNSVGTEMDLLVLGSEIMNQTTNSNNTPRRTQTIHTS
jgi:hypothetical protein